MGEEDALQIIKLPVHVGENFLTMVFIRYFSNRSAGSLVQAETAVKGYEVGAVYGFKHRCFINLFTEWPSAHNRRW